MSNLIVEITIKPVDGMDFSGQVLTPKRVVFYTDPERASTIPFVDKIKVMVITHEEGDPEKGLFAMLTFNYERERVGLIENLQGAVAVLVYDKPDPQHYFVVDCKWNDQSSNDTLLLNSLQEASESPGYLDAGG
ncbi:hypothetical protein LCGC14_3069820, partial [marine sediment metagenome]